VKPHLVTSTIASLDGPKGRAKLLKRAPSNRWL
jgi:hypothetical protein